MGLWNKWIRDLRFNGDNNSISAEERDPAPLPTKRPSTASERTHGQISNDLNYAQTPLRFAHYFQSDFDNDFVMKYTRVRVRVRVCFV